MSTMREDSLLQQALAAARARHELTARDLFLEVVEINPRNEVAWMWLTGLLDELDDCIYACERVLEINPQNGHARTYLAKLLEKKQVQVEEKRRVTEVDVQHAWELTKKDQRESALGLVRDALRNYALNPEGWRLIAELSPDMDEQIQALKKILELTPEDVKARETLARLQHFKKNPHELAAYYEEQGSLDKAVDLYNTVLMQPEFKKQWKSVYRKIIQLRMRQDEKIAHISPAASIARLAAGPPLLYLFLLLIHVGINPLADPDFTLWVGLIWTIVGGALIAFASVRSHHRLWFLLFKDVSTGGTPVARLSLAVAGWLLVLFPFMLMFFMAYRRLFYFL